MREGLSLLRMAHHENGSLHDAARAAEEKEREVQRQYWLEHTPDKPTVETMMLDSKAAEIDQMERPEVRAALAASRSAGVRDLQPRRARPLLLATGHTCSRDP